MTNEPMTNELLSRIWDVITGAVSGFMRGFERTITAVFGSSNARFLRRLQPKVDAIGELEERYRGMSDAELKEQTDKFRARLKAGETLDDLLVEAFAVCREAGRRFLGMRHYDVQLIGGMVLHKGMIAEMVTGEGKTLVATLPAYLNALEGKGVHVVTVNDYLARRDMEWMAPLYMGLGITVGAIQSNMSVGERQAAYACDITYGTNNEFGFDYLRDNMRPAARGDDRFPKHMQQSQGPLNYAIIDEVDNILIDEARTPLIISGPAFDDPRKYSEADRIARQLVKDQHFNVNEKDHNVTLTDEGVRMAEKLAGVESFYTAGNMEWPHLIDNALKAHHLYKRDVNYVVKEGRVVIVDEFTGRLMEGRQWSDGLHQAVEAKEGVRIKEETQTLATITLQNFFKLYKKLSGMTGTAMTEAGEFWKIYKLDVIAIPTNRPLQRVEHPDVIYASEREKYEAVADEIERLHKWDEIRLRDGEWILGQIEKENENEIRLIPQGASSRKNVKVISKRDVDTIQRRGRPVLVGTVSIEKSERLSKLLDIRGIPHEVLNAKYHKREAEIVAQAGRLGAVTIATNMAGRGTDIVLGGNPETMAWARLQDKYPTRLDVPREEWDALIEEIEAAEKMSEEGELVKSLGGLHVIGTERHEARRIDLQLRGRCGRQGDPGSSRFYLSLEDDLMRIFAGPWIQALLKKSLPEGEPLESKMITRRIEGAQKKVEERNFEIRKNLLEYDEVMDEQRKRVYSYRQRILDGANCRHLIEEMLRREIDYHVDLFMDRDYGVESFAQWAGNRLGTSLDGRDYRGMAFADAEQLARDEAKRFAETQVHDAIEENLPLSEDSSEWAWGALAKFANARWGLNLRDRDLKKIGREEVSEFLIEQAQKAIDRVDLSDGAPFLEDDYRIRTVAEWVKHKFGIEIPLEEFKDADSEEIKQRIVDRTHQQYDQKEVEYPVIAGFYRYSNEQGRIDRESLVAWAAERFGVPLTFEDIKNKQRDEIEKVLIEASRENQRKGREVLREGEKRLERCLEGVPEDVPLRGQVSSERIRDFCLWLKEELGFELAPDEMEEMLPEQLTLALLTAVDEKHHPEMRRLERAVLLEIVDTAWKDHLLVMDHLRSSVGLKGYAQLDPKVEYKREGMKLFDRMWQSIYGRTTELIFRVEQLSEDFVGSTWVETKAEHETAQSALDFQDQQQQAIDATQSEEVTRPIRNVGQRIGRNEPCPCGSGKKYKNCCMRSRV